MDKMREEFEAWARSQGLYVYYIECDDMYSVRATDTAWWAWQASRKALVVELPTAWNASYTDKAIVMDASSVVEALEDAGISYK